MSDQGPGITTKKTTKLYIPHPHAENCSIVGVLEQLAPEQPTQGRRIALVSPPIVQRTIPSASDPSVDSPRITWVNTLSVRRRTRVLMYMQA